MAPISPSYKPDPHYLSLGDGFGDPVAAAGFPKHMLRWRNDRAAETVGLHTLTDREWVEHFGHFAPLPDNMLAPHALRYHGHQFRHYNPDIGDGRGFLYAQLRDDKGRLLDLGTKGSGTTPYSRSGDGKLTLKGGVREILATEMLEALGVSTSKTFSLIETGEALERGDEPSPTRSAVMVRLSHSHIRIGTFQRLAYFSETEKIAQLVGYVLETYFDIKPTADDAENACLMLEQAIKNITTLTADIMAAGFVHGVLNTDNINITGENFDYGPWRFLPTLQPDFTAAYFDQTGLYAYGRQPEAMHWNLYQLGGALVEIAPEADIRAVLVQWQTHLTTAMRRAYLRRLGITGTTVAQDDDFLNKILGWMVQSQIPFHQFFHDWYGGANSIIDHSPVADAYRRDDFQDIKEGFNHYRPLKHTARDHAHFQNARACSLLIEEVEDIWTQIDQHDDWSALMKKIDQIREMGQALA